jgi:hypothetical protein
MNPECKVAISGSFRKHLKDIGIASANFKSADIDVLAPLTTEIVAGGDTFVFFENG